MSPQKRIVVIVMRLIVEFAILPVVITAAIVARFTRRAIDVGIGPEPLINNVYHARALRRFHWSAETFVDHTYFITSQFDYNLSCSSELLNKISRLFFTTYFFALFRYRCLYIYFNGGGLYQSIALWLIEPFLYRIAGTKVVVMPYGSDVQDTHKSRELFFKHAVDSDYRIHYRRRLRITTQVALWSRWANHVISGCDWVDYMNHWDTLCLSHFAVDENSKPDYVHHIEQESRMRRSHPTAVDGRKIKVLHAPNHKEIKGSRFFKLAIMRLQADGVPVELVEIQGISNEQVLALIDEADIVADQLVIGWYAMFALEGMNRAKPVLCYIREDLEQLYIRAGLIKHGELPIVKCSPENVEDVIRELVWDAAKRIEIGRKGREFIKRHHSLEVVGDMFNKINSKLGLRRP
jgi:hypothetical protein